MDLKLRDKIVLVTGAGSGIGAAIARAFCDEGAKTVYVDINTEGLKIAVTGYEKNGFPLECDVSERTRVGALFDTIKKRFGTLHILVNNAAVNTADYVTDLKEEDLDRIFNINIKGYIYTTMEALPLMKKTGFGRLIYINSGSGLKASAGLSLYSASKYFNRGFAISVALEAGKYNITANSICPSDVYPQDRYPQALHPGDSDFHTANASDTALQAGSWKNDSLLKISLEKEGASSLEELIERRTAKNPMKRSCTKEDITQLALFLASESSGFINGQSIGLNGGAIPY